MKKLRVYLDTSVIGGCFDDQFKDYSLNIVKQIKTEKAVGVISEITIREIENAPDIVKDHFESYLPILDTLSLTDEVVRLAEDYLEEKIITRKFYEDALHIAFGTVAGVDVLVSWNFKHIVNFNRIKMFNGVNLIRGYNTLNIYSPMEVFLDEAE